MVLKINWLRPVFNCSPPITFQPNPFTDFCVVIRTNVTIVVAVGSLLEYYLVTWRVLPYRITSNQFVHAFSPFSALTLLVGRQEGHQDCKKLDVGMLVMAI